MANTGALSRLGQVARRGVLLGVHVRYAGPAGRGAARQAADGGRVRAMGASDGVER